MNILMISREIPPIGGGVGRVALDLSIQLALAGHRVHILTMHFGSLPMVESDGSVTIQRLTCGRRHQDSADFGSMLRFVLKARRAARTLAKSEAFNLVHAQAIIPDGAVAIHVGRRYKLPVVVTAHGSDVPGYDPKRFGWLHRVLLPFWKRVAKRADLLTSPSEYLRRLIIAADDGVEVMVIPNGINPDRLSDHASRRSGFLIVSRLIERKNYHRFFEALSAIGDPQTVHVVGEGPELPRLRLLASRTIHDVVFHGWLEHGSDRWRHLYEHSRFFVLPSLNENFPINLLEAQLAGLTILASPIPGIREVLGEHAIYFADLTAEGITATIEDVLTRPDTERVEQARLAAERARRHFSWTAIAGRYEEEYVRLVEAHIGSQ